jgi:hypothetical protein
MYLFMSMKCILIEMKFDIDKYIYIYGKKKLKVTISVQQHIAQIAIIRKIKETS